MITIAIRTLEVPGAVVTYDVRPAHATTEPTLMLIGSPMAADGFAALAERFPDRTVVTYDPRGAGRSRRTDVALEATPAEHADDLHRVISALDAGPVELFASSGGAVNALALVAQHPEQVTTLVAHEPPVWQVLPDREVGLAAAVDIHETYQREGFGPAMAKFIALVSYEGPFPADYLERPAPGPGHVRPADRGRRLKDRPAPGPEHDLGESLPSRTSRHCARHPPASSSGSERPPGRRDDRPGDGGRRRAARDHGARRLPRRSRRVPRGRDPARAGGPDAFAATLRRVLVAEHARVPAGR